MDRQYYVYLLTNKGHTVLYTGVTNNLKRRIYEHREKFVLGFTQRYNVSKLIYYEVLNDIEPAITREKQIKSWSRRRKLTLINRVNPEWKDLYDQL
ncbi:MAG: GIY-YIG nuclease family protein [Elusimicrobia bacterium]|nr:GIY-YIG nuclease family protein [Elusimicrobiota bacterium]